MWAVLPYSHPSCRWRTYQASEMLSYISTQEDYEHALQCLKRDMPGQVDPMPNHSRQFLVHVCDSFGNGARRASIKRELLTPFLVSVSGTWVRKTKSRCTPYPWLSCKRTVSIRTNCVPKWDQANVQCLNEHLRTASRSETRMQRKITSTSLHSTCLTMP